MAGSPGPAYRAGASCGGRRKARGVMTMKVSVFWLVSEFAPIKSFTMGVADISGSPLMERRSLDCMIPERTEDSSSRNRMVCSTVRLLRMGIPLMEDPARERMSNWSCSVTSLLA